MGRQGARSGFAANGQAQRTLRDILSDCQYSSYSHRAPPGHFHSETTTPYSRLMSEPELKFLPIGEQLIATI